MAARILALVIVLTGLAWDLGGYPLLDPDEGRNAEVAREMAASGEWLLPTLNGLPYLDKPVLDFAARAVSLTIFGRSEWAVRLPSLLFTLGTLAVVFAWARRERDSDTAWLAVIATAASPLTLGFARTVIFDAALCLFVVLALAAFRQAQLALDERTGDGYWWTVGAWAAIAFGVLTKGPIALALPLMVVIPWSAAVGRWRHLANAAALLSFAAILLPWLFAMQRRTPDFLEYALVSETFRRLTTDEFNRTGPIWYFVPIALAAALPWTASIIAGIRPLREALAERRQWLLLLVIWVIVPLVFFSLSQSKRPQYLLPLVPAMGLLAAEVLRSPRLAPRAAAGATLVAAGVLLVLGGHLFGTAFRASASVADAIPATAIRLGGISLLAGATAIALRQRREWMVLALAVPVASIPVTGAGLMQVIGAERSAAGLAHAIEREAGDNAVVIGVRAFPLSLPFYIDSRILLSTDDAGELTSNYIPDRVERWRRDPETALRALEWWREYALECPRPAVFVVRSGDAEARAFLSNALSLIAESRRYAVYGPCGGPQFATR